jgi:hypothetical protein
MCRCPDLPPGMCATQMAWKPLIIIEGPREPTSMYYVLEKTVAFFAMHDPGLSGTCGVKLWDAFLKRVIEHKPVIAGLDADTPMNGKLSESVGHGAKTGCPKCAHRGETGNAGGSTVR